MSAFENYIQVELPKRGYLDTDVGQESIIVRRGPGPRQLDAVDLEEGQVLAKVNGELVGLDVAVRKAIFTVAQPNETWTINHNLGSEDVIVQAFDENGFVVIPNTIQVVDEDVIQLTFGTAQAGTARIVFLDFEGGVSFPAQPFDITGFYPGIPAADAILLRIPFARAVTFAANFASARGSASANATGSTTFNVQKNGTNVGTMTFGAGAATATFTTSGGAPVSFAAGDYLSVIAPATPDATLADVGFVLVGTR